MSLTFRLNFVFALLFLLLLAAGTVTIIGTARESVAREVDSSVRLMRELLAVTSVGRSADDAAQALRSTLFDSSSDMGGIRHLDVALLSLDGRTIEARTPASSAAQAPPTWFQRLVTPPPVEYRHRLGGPPEADLPNPGSIAEIAIRPNPSDEIAEAWEETRRSLILLIVFALLAVPLFYLTVRLALKPLQSIVSGMHAIERGTLSARLAPVDLADLAPIVSGFNRMVDELARKDKENRFLHQRTLDIREHEQQHLARELHDEMGQSISAIKALATAIARATESGADAASASRTISGICDDMYTSVRGMMQRLRPSVLDELGLGAALARMVEDWNTHNAPLRCELELQCDAERLDNEVAIRLFRIVQEALTNVARHASAREVQVTLSEQAAQWALSISDDGDGFDPNTTARGLGLLGMQERIDGLGGTLTLDTAPGHGTALHFSWPAPAAQPRSGRH